MNLQLIFKISNSIEDGYKKPVCLIIDNANVSKSGHKSELIGKKTFTWNKKHPLYAIKCGIRFDCLFIDSRFTCVFFGGGCYFNTNEDTVQ